jgi:hypothetical protein
MDTIRSYVRTHHGKDHMIDSATKEKSRCKQRQLTPAHVNISSCLLVQFGRNARLFVDPIRDFHIDHIGSEGEHSLEPTASVSRIMV